MDNSRAGQGIYKMNLKYLVVLENKEALKKQQQQTKNYWGMLMWHKAFWKNCYWPKLEECEQENNSIGL